MKSALLVVLLALSLSGCKKCLEYEQRLTTEEELNQPGKPHMGSKMVTAWRQVCVKWNK